MNVQISNEQFTERVVEFTEVLRRSICEALPDTNRPEDAAAVAEALVFMLARHVVLSSADCTQATNYCAHQLKQCVKSLLAKQGN
jgi:hypothetical protein